MKNYSAALMPLSTHVLPRGRMALRIFEPRYVRMVKEAFKNERDFVMCMFNSKGAKSDNTHIFHIGSKVSVVDFDQGDDGLLGITVEAVELVHINAITAEDDGLRVGDCSVIAVDNDVSDEVSYIGDKLQSVFETYPELSRLYEDTPFDDAYWVVMRWLELLPISTAQKQSLLHAGKLEHMVDYLNNLIE